MNILPVCVQEDGEKHVYYDEGNRRYKTQPNGTFGD